MKHICFSLLLLVSLIGFSQKPKIIQHGNDTLEVITYHKNGHVKDSVWKTVELLVGKPDKIDPKHPGDSIVIKIEKPFGIAKQYYKSGKLKTIAVYGINGGNHKTTEYRKNGNLFSQKELPYGIRKYYNKKGRQVRQSDFNKNKFVRIPKSCKNQKHLTQTAYATRIIKKQLILSNSGKEIRINPGTLLSCQLINDTTVIRHMVYEGMCNDSLLFSQYDYDLENNKNRLKPVRVSNISPAQIRSVMYATKNVRKTYNTASFMEIAGFNIALLPLVGGPVIFGAAVLLQPALAATVVAGIPVYLFSKQVFKKTVPKTYQFSEWKIKT